MSFVSILARSDFITIMSDGRMNDSKTGYILSETEQKFISYYDKKSFVAFTGNRGFAAHITTYLFTDSIDYKQRANSIEEILKQPELIQLRQENNGSYLQMAFGGVNTFGDLELYTYLSKNDVIQKEVIPSDQEQIIFLGNQMHHQQAYEFIMKEIHSKQHTTPSDYLSTQKLVNNIVADKDSFVNKTTFRLVIKKQ